MTIIPTLKSRLPDIIGELPDAVKGAIEETAHAIEAGAKDRVPVDTGTLRDAIHVEETEEGYAVVAGNTEAFYGHIVEHGGSRTPARPFLLPAGEVEAAKNVERVKQALEDL